MLNLKIKSYLKLIFFISFVSIISAYFIEYVLGFQPCNLCLIERVPYFLSIILITINSISNKNEKFFIMLLILIFIFSLSISFYHFGIEQDFFEESAVCSVKDGLNIISKDELLRQLNQINVSCKDVTFKVFGMSLTTFNIILSLIILIILTNIFKNYEKYKN